MTDQNKPQQSLLPFDAQDQLLKLDDVVKLTRQGKTSIYRRIGLGTFPAPVNLSENCVRWKLSDVRAWMDKLTSGQSPQPEPPTAVVLAHPAKKAPPPPPVPPILLPSSAPDGEPLTMSSREIAELVNSRHDKVKQSIERLAERGVIVRPPMGDEQETDAMGRLRTTQIYRVGKRDSYVIVAQLSPEFTARLVDRWQELEAEVQRKPTALPDLTDPAVLVPLLSTYATRTQIAEQKVVELAPKAEAFDRLEASEGAMNIRLAAKVLNIPERKFTAWLESNRWAYRHNGIGPLQAYVEKRNVGYLAHRPHTYRDRETNEDRTVAQMLVTPKGIARLAQLFARQDDRKEA